ncbi:MAG: hypothetical protein R6W88_07710 [Desulfobacterales bacterium]
MKKKEVIELIANGENSSVEFKRDDIRPEQLAKEAPDMPASESQWIDRLSGLGFMTNDALGNTVCSLAGMVLFGIH